MLKNSASLLLIAAFVFVFPMSIYAMIQDDNFRMEVLPYIFAFSGIIVFWFRQKFRIWYGMLEFLFGVFLCFWSTRDYNPSRGFDAAVMSQLIAGLYVIVRGMDNIGKTVKAYPHVLDTKKTGRSAKIDRNKVDFRRKWARLFSFD